LEEEARRRSEERKRKRGVAPRRGMVGELATSYSEREGSGWEGHGAIVWLDKAARGPPGGPGGPGGPGVPKAAHQK